MQYFVMFLQTFPEATADFFEFKPHKNTRRLKDQQMAERAF
jgi:hypothetical protein